MENGAISISNLNFGIRLQAEPLWDWADQHLSTYDLSATGCSKNLPVLAGCLREDALRSECLLGRLVEYISPEHTILLSAGAAYHRA